MYIAPLEAALVVGGIGVGVEAATMVLRPSLLRKIGYGLVFMTTVMSIVLLLMAELWLPTLLVATVAAYRAVNALRAVAGRTREPRLTYASRRSSLFLLVYQLIALGLWWLSVQLGLTGAELVTVLLVASVIVSPCLLLITRRNLARTLHRPSDKYTPDADLPTVSVCIPARNETADLPPCLESVLRNDYPKLEVLVLDDCSQDSTSEIIKGFAQDGVRFISGEPPHEGWLAKNQAYQTLSEAASGEILLFMGVDVRLDGSAIRSMVGTLTARHKQMLSVLPHGQPADGLDSLIQPLRYWWELVLPRRMLNRPPVLSSLWMIRREALLASGGFGSVKRNVLPEGYLARELAKKDGYSFLRAGAKLGLGSGKRLPEQWQTAVRTRYPILRKKPENVLLLTLAEFWLLALPLGVFVAGFAVPLSTLWLLAGSNSLLLFYIHLLIVRAWGVSSKSLPVALLPAAVATELWLLQLSMWRYEFTEVTWKDRNICIPVMKQYRHLPRT